MMIEPMIEARYDPYRLTVVAYDIVGATPELIDQALANIEKDFPKGRKKEVEKLSLFLIANTKRRRDAAEADHLALAGFVAVGEQYPLKTIETVVGNWHKRTGEEAIFTPSQAEFYRALEEAAAPQRVLEGQLKAMRRSLVAIPPDVFAPRVIQKQTYPLSDITQKIPQTTDGGGPSPKK